jgi:hypothetical protein
VQEEAGPRPQRPVLSAPDLSLFPRQPEGRATSPLAAMGMWALNLKAGGPCLTPRPQPATSSPLAAATGEIGSLAVGLTRWRRQPARWPRLVVSASGRKSKSSREDGDESKEKASSSGRSYCPCSGSVSIGAIGEGSRPFACGKWSSVCRLGAD